MKYKMHRQTGELQFVLEGVEDIPWEIRKVMDEAAGKKHSKNGKVMAALADCLNLWEARRAGGGEETEGEVIQGILPGNGDI